MEDFYRDQRRRFDVLMDGGEPVGNRWNYDEDNREPPPKKQKTLGVAEALPAARRRHRRPRSAATSIAMNLDTVGVDGPRLFAVTPAEAKRALDRFIEHRLAAFGRYEDAIMGEDWAMSHSLLSVPLNLGVLHPLDAVEAAEQRLPPKAGARWPPSRASSARSSAGASTCGISTGTSARTTPGNNALGAHQALPDVVDRPRRRRRHRGVPAPRDRGRP